jgi:putative transposase
MRQLNGLYTQSSNKRHRRTGHLFQGRCKAVLIQKDTHLLEVCRYVVLNPVRAGIVAWPEDRIWSSDCGTVGKEGSHRCLTSKWVIGQFSDNKVKGQRAYGQFVRSGIGKESIWSEVKGQTILGQPEFVERLVDHLKGCQDVLQIPRSQRYVNRPTLETLFEENTIRDKRKRNSRIARAALEYGYSQSEIARHLGLHYSAISNLLREKPDQ